MADYITDLIESYESDLQKVTHNGYALKHIKEQTPEVCLAAVKQNGWTLQCVQEQTPEICIAAVKQIGYVLKFVEDRKLKKKIRLQLNL